LIKHRELKDEIMELTTNELKYLKNSETIIDIIKKTKLFLRDRKCTIIEPPSGLSNIHIYNDKLHLSIEISIPLSSK